MYWMKGWKTHHVLYRGSWTHHVLDAGMEDSPCTGCRDGGLTIYWMKGWRTHHVLDEGVKHLPCIG